MTAQISAAPTYHGRACRKCGATLRLVSNYHCVACNRKDPPGRTRAGRDMRALVREHRAVERNTILLRFYSDVFDRRGERRTAGVTYE